MQAIPVTSSDEDIKNVIRRWVNLLAHGRFDDAVAMLSPETIPANGSVNPEEHPRWTAELVEEVFGQPYCGVHVNLPGTALARGHCVGGLTARFLLRSVSGSTMALVLEDIHVM
jgi:hypothetical protein